MDTDKKDGIFYPYAVKKVNGSFYLYNIVTNGLFEMDRESCEVLVNKADVNDAKYAKLKESLEDNYILVNSENDAKLEKIYKKTVHDKKSLNATSLTLMVSQECNLRCKYCYGEGGEYKNRGKMDFKTAQKAVDFLIANTEQEKLSVCFFGGEPLLNLPLIKEVINYIKEIEAGKNKKFSFSMTTNATLITEEIERFIKDNKIFLTVSLDGPKSTNDSNRYFGNKKGSYEDVKNRTKNLKDMIMIRATLAPPNLNLIDSVSHIIDDMEFEEVAWSEADNLMSDKDYDIIKDATFKLFDALAGLIREEKYEEVKKYHTFLNYLRKFDKDGLRSKGCGAGSNLMAVDIDGKIYPCHRFVGIQEAVLGNVDECKLNNHQFYENIDLANC